MIFFNVAHPHSAGMYVGRQSVQIENAAQTHALLCLHDGSYLQINSVPFFACDQNCHVALIPSIAFSGKAAVAKEKWRMVRRSIPHFSGPWYSITATSTHA